MWCNKECFEANFDICIIIILFLIKETITMAFGCLSNHDHTASIYQLLSNHVGGSS